jgi:hypothetical protein
VPKETIIALAPWLRQEQLESTQFGVFKPKEPRQKSALLFIILVTSVLLTRTMLEINAHENRPLDSPWHRLVHCHWIHLAAQHQMTCSHFTYIGTLGRKTTFRINLIQAAPVSATIVCSHCCHLHFSPNTNAVNNSYENNA